MIHSFIMCSRGKSGVFNCFIFVSGREKRIRDSLARLESALTLVGGTGVEDRLQEGVPRTVRALLDAGIIVWVLTGDKPETAVNIAYSAALFSQTDKLLYLMSRDKVITISLAKLTLVVSRIVCKECHARSRELRAGWLLAMT